MGLARAAAKQAPGGTIGCLELWEILTRQVPWEGYLPVEILAAVVTQGRRLDMLHATRHATRRPLTKLLNSCCEENPAKRPSFIDIKQQLEAVVDAYG